LRALAQRAHKLGWYVVAGVFATLAASLETRQWVRLRWDGEDWIYRWAGSVAVNSHPFWRPAVVEELRRLFLYKYNPIEGDTIVDVGVENGDEIPLFCGMVGPRGRVIAIEADPSCCRRVRKLKGHLGLDNLEVVEAAVGAHNGVVKFSQDLGSQSNQVLQSDSSARHMIEVPVRTLASILAEHKITKVDLLKANIEGAETEMLKGLPRTNLVRHVCISCHDFKAPSLRTYDTVYSWLTSNAYAVDKVHPEDPRRPWVNYYLYGRLSGISDSPEVRRV
jgi:FkbM family methyltransferase